MRNSIRPFARALLALPLAFVAAHGADDTDLKLLRDQIRALEQKLLVLERKQELKDEAVVAAAPSMPKITVNDKGVTLASADAANSLRVRGLVQLDSRLFFDSEGVTNNAFVLRRARLITEGQFAKNYSFQLVSEFGGSSVSILDANLNILLKKGLQFRLGKFKSPIGLEQLQSDSWTFFNERSIVSNLVPNRDLGIQAWGDLADNRVSYAVGVFNGVADASSSTNTDFDNEKDLAARVTFTPFRNEPGSPLQGLTFGLAGNIGREKTAAGRPSGYRTDGQQTFFSYNSSVVSDGQNWRVSPQLDYRHGSFGILSEYVVSTVNVRPNATGAKAELQNKAWQIAAGYVLTGEDSSYAGVVPRSNFDYAAGTWGAFEITGRIARVEVDDAAFPLFAAPASSANKATSFGVGLNWYLSRAVVLKLDYYQTDFGFNAAAPAISSAAVLRQDEKAFITRLQLGF